MIARFFLALERPLNLVQSAEYKPIEFEVEQCRVKIYPPLSSQLENTAKANLLPIIKQTELLIPSDKPIIREDLKIGGRASIDASMLQIDFAKAEFERRDTLPVQDPKPEFIFEVVNAFIRGVRLLSKDAYLKPIPIESMWSLWYLNDDGTELPPENGKFRRRFSGRISRRYCAVTQELWDRLPQLMPRAFATPWETLLLDAHALLPEVGPALVLAATALEVLISEALEHLSGEAKVQSTVWQWINNRDDRRLNPSVGEQYDTLLRAICGKSLKDERQDLWAAFMNLKSVRNTFAHEGQITYGKDRKPVTQMFAAELLAKTRDIIDWIEPGLPAGWQSPKLKEAVPVEMVIPFQ